MGIPRAGTDPKYVERGGIRQRRAKQQPRQLGRPAAAQPRRPLRIQSRCPLPGAGRGAYSGAALWNEGDVEVPSRWGAKQGSSDAGKKIKYNGVITQLEHHYRQYRKQGTSNAGMDEYLKKVMVEYDCPECAAATA